MGSRRRLRKALKKQEQRHVKVVRDLRERDERQRSTGLWEGMFGTVSGIVEEGEAEERGDPRGIIKARKERDSSFANFKRAIWRENEEVVIGRSLTVLGRKAEEHERLIRAYRQKRLELAPPEVKARLDRIRTARVPIKKIPDRVLKIYEEMNAVEGKALDQIEKLGFKIIRWRAKGPRGTEENINMKRVVRTTATAEDVRKAEEIAWNSISKIDELEKQAQQYYGLFGRGGIIGRRIEAEHGRLRELKLKELETAMERIEDLKATGKQCVRIALKHRPIIFGIVSELERMR